MKKYSLNIIVIISLLFSMGPAYSMTWLVDSVSDNVVLPAHAACENNSDVDKQTDNGSACAKHCATHVAVTSIEQDYVPLNSRGRLHTNTKTVSVSLSHKIVLPPPKIIQLISYG